MPMTEERRCEICGSIYHISDVWQSNICQACDALGFDEEDSLEDDETQEDEDG